MEGVEGAEVIEELELVLLKESVGVAAVVVVEGAGEVYARVSVVEKVQGRRDYLSTVDIRGMFREERREDVAEDHSARYYRSLR